MGAEEWRLKGDRCDRSSEAAHDVDAGPLGVRPGWTVATAEADGALQLSQQSVHLHMGPFAADGITGRFGVVDVGLQLHQATAVLPLRPGVQAGAEVSGDRRVGPAGEVEYRHLDARRGQQPRELSQTVAVGQTSLSQGRVSPLNSTPAERR